MIKKLVFFCLSLFCIHYAYTQPFSNSNFICRPEYVMATLEKIGDFEEDMNLGITLCSKSGTNDNVIIGIKELYYILYNETYNSNEQLRFSVGKIFLRDTLYIADTIKYKFKQYIVNLDSLGKLRKIDNDEIVQQYFVNNKLVSKVSKEMRNALIYYFDRAFYQIRETGNGWLLDLKYNYNEFNVIFLRKNGKLFRQVWDKYGNLSSYEEWDPETDSAK